MRWSHSLDSLATAGDAIFTDVSTITGLLAQPTTGQPEPPGPQHEAREGTR